MTHITTTYGQTLGTLMKKRGMSIGQLKIKMGIPSKTSISRVLNDKCARRSLTAFNNKLMAESNPLRLSNSDKSMLNSAIFSSIVGVDHFDAYSSLARFLECGDVEYQSIDCNIRKIYTDDMYLKELNSLTQYTEYISSCASAVISVVNCIGFSFLQTLSTLFKKKNNISIDHYIYIDNLSNICGGLSDCSLFALKYEAYSLYEITNDNILAKENFILIKITENDGSTHTDVIYTNDGFAYDIISFKNSIYAGFLTETIGDIKGKSICLSTAESLSEKYVPSLSLSAECDSNDLCLKVFSNTLMLCDCGKTIGVMCSDHMADFIRDMDIYKTEFGLK